MRKITAIILILVFILSGCSIVKKDIYDFSLKLKATDSIQKYLEILEGDQPDVTTVFTVRDIQGFSLTEKEIELLKQLGLDQADLLLEQAYHNLIGIVQNGKTIYQYIGGDELSEYGTTIGKHAVKAVSATLNAGNKTEIVIDGKDYAVNGRGINIVVVETNSGRVLDSVVFDTHVNEMPCTRNKD